MLLDYLRDCFEELREILMGRSFHPSLKVIGFVIISSMLTGACTAWVLKDRGESISSFKARALKADPLVINAKIKTVRESECGYVSKKPITTLSVKVPRQALKVKLDSTASDPIVYVRNNSSSKGSHCIRLSSLTENYESLGLERGVHEVFVGTRTPNQWTGNTLTIQKELGHP